MKKNFFIVVLLLMSAFFFNACQKDLLHQTDTNYESQLQKNDFFNFSFASNNHPYLIKNIRAGKTDAPIADTSFINSIIDDLLIKEVQNPFADQLTKLAGYPIWKQAVTRHDSTQKNKVAWIPLAKLDNQRTDAILVCTQKNNQFHYIFAHSRYNKTLLSLADSLHLPDDEINYRQQIEKVTDYFDANLFGNSPTNNNSTDLSLIFLFVIVCDETPCTNTQCCDMFNNHTHTFCTAFDLGVNIGGGSNGGTGDNTSYNGTTNGGGGSSSSNYTNDLYSDFWEQMQGLAYHDFMQNLNDFIENNNIPLVPEELAGGMGFSFHEIYTLAIENDCINAPFNDYIPGSAFDNCLWEAMYVNYNATQAVHDFNAYMGLELTQTQFDALIKDHCSNIGISGDFLECAKMEYVRQKHAQLKANYSKYAIEFSQAGFTSIGDFIDTHGYYRYLATVAIYESMMDPDAAWDIPNVETLLYYCEMMSTQLYPFLTVLPYGIGDVIDIYSSCGSFSFDCALALGGLLLPNEFFKIPPSKIIDTWKVVANLEALQVAWKFITKCPLQVRTNPQILDGVRIALERTLKKVDEIKSYAAVPYIDNATVEHIFRGSNDGGVHHISALIANPDVYKIHNRGAATNGCYKASIYKNGVQMNSKKGFFPDEWNEEKVIDAIKEAWGNKQHKGGNVYEGTYGDISIRIFIQNAGTPYERIISAFPF